MKWITFAAMFQDAAQRYGLIVKAEVNKGQTIYNHIRQKSVFDEKYRQTLLAW